MAGTITGGKAAAQTNKAKYGPDFYREIGRKGGSVSRPETRMFRKSPELASVAGKIGGTKSRRGPVKVTFVAEDAVILEPKRTFWQRLFRR